MLDLMPDVWHNPIILERFTHSRGESVIVAAPFKMDRNNPEIRGTKIEIDGELWRVVSVDRFMPASPISQGEKIELGIARVASN